MSVVIVGGHDRMHRQYKDVCKKHGCKCKVFTQCPTDFKSKIGSPDMVIVFTKTVAHKMAVAAAQQAEKTGAVIRHCNSSSTFALNGVLTDYFQTV